jgi:hypothetical protein
VRVSDSWTSPSALIGLLRADEPMLAQIVITASIRSYEIAVLGKSDKEF